MWSDENVERVVVAVADAGVVTSDSVVVRRANASLASELAVPGFRVYAFDEFGFVDADDDFGDDVVFVKKCVMRHYDQLTFPVPAVIVARL